MFVLFDFPVRIGKEKLKYAEEVVKQTKFYEDKVAGGAEECEIKMAKALLDESKMMIPDCQIRLEKALCDLNNLLQVSWLLGYVCGFRNVITSSTKPKNLSMRSQFTHNTPKVFIEEFSPNRFIMYPFMKKINFVV
ncbi:tubulin-specific chaperone A [Paragonimus westermani]|uniref:Tubulin-specific chaperone A n=1 Tax=Paragonimus westermani TaxID=34504 RepID=A0A5J4NFI7_9TREM|nr:tubulin-specific chaperone A [Paragonimus westermani]